jgi:hypothetical protein
MGRNRPVKHSNTSTQQDSGDVLDLSEDQHLCQVFTELLVATGKTLPEPQQIEDERKQAIQQRMGEASKVIFPTGVVSWKKNKTGSRRFMVRVD